MMTSAYWEVRSWGIIARPYPLNEWDSTGFPVLLGKGICTSIHSVWCSSKGITDLLLLNKVDRKVNVVVLNVTCPSKKLPGYLVISLNETFLSRRNQPDKSPYNIGLSTKYVHASLSTESIKNSQSVNPYRVRSSILQPYSYRNPKTLIRLGLLAEFLNSGGLPVAIIYGQNDIWSSSNL